MSDSIQLILPDEEKKTADGEEDILSVDAKAAALAASALKMAEEAKRAAERLAEVRASLRESRLHAESVRSTNSLAEPSGPAEPDEIPFLGNAYEGSGDSTDNPLFPAPTKEVLEDNHRKFIEEDLARELVKVEQDARDRAENEMFERFFYEKAAKELSAISQEATSRAKELEKIGKKLSGKYERFGGRTGDLNYSELTIESALLSKEVKIEDDVSPKQEDQAIAASQHDHDLAGNAIIFDAEFIPNFEAQVWPEDTTFEAERKLAEDERSQKAMLDELPLDIEENETLGPEHSNVASDHEDVGSSQNETDSKEPIGEQLCEEMHPSSTCLINEIIAEEIQEIATAMASIGSRVDAVNAEEISAPRHNVELQSNISQEQGVHVDLSDCQVNTSSNEITPMVEPPEIADINVEPKVGVTSTDEILADEKQNAYDAPASLDVVAETNVENVDTDKHDNGNETLRAPSSPVSTSRLSVDTLDHAGSPNVDSNERVPIEAPALTEPDVRIDGGGACLALTEEIWAEEIQEVSEALSSLGFVAKSHSEQLSTGDATNESTSKAAVKAMEEDDDIREVVEPKSSMVASCLSTDVGDFSEIVSAIGLQPKAANERGVDDDVSEGQGGKASAEATADAVGIPTDVDVSLPGGACLALTEEILADEIQEVSEALASLGLVAKANHDQLLSVEGTTESKSKASVEAEEDDDDDIREVVPKLSVAAGSLSADVLDIPEQESAILLEPKTGNERDVDDDVPVSQNNTISVKATEPEMESQTVAGESLGGGACIALTEEILAEEMQEVSQAIASLGFVSTANDGPVVTAEKSDESATNQAYLNAKEEDDDDIRDVTADVQTSSVAASCLSVDFNDISAALSAIVLKPNSAKERHVNEDKISSEDAAHSVELPAVANVSLEGRACLALSEEMLAEELQEVTGAIASLGLVAKKNDEFVVALKGPNDPSNQTSSDAAAVSCLSEQMAEVSTALQSVGFSPRKAERTDSSISTDIVSSANDGADQSPAKVSGLDDPRGVVKCDAHSGIALSEETSTKEIQEVSTTIASLAPGADSVHKPAERSEEEASSTPQPHPVSCLSEEAQGVTAALSSIGSSAKATYEKLVETASTVETPAPLNHLSASCMSDEFQEAAFNAIGLGGNSPRAQGENKGPRFQPKKSLVDDEEKEKADVDDVKGSTTCLNLSEQIIAEEMEEMSATIASFGLKGNDQQSDKKEEKPNAEREASRPSEEKSQVQEAQNKDNVKANVGNDMLVESMAADRANCGCIVM